MCHQTVGLAARYLEEHRIPTVVFGCYLDASAAFDHLVADGTDPATIVCFGESLGGAVSIEVATRRRCGAIITVSVFTRLADVGRRLAARRDDMASAPLDRRRGSDRFGSG